jgi:hypothetical protein
VNTFTRDFGSLQIEVRYLYDSDLLKSAKEQGLHLASQVKSKKYSDRFIEFFCENVIVSWGGIKDVNSGLDVPFKADFAYMVFSDHPKLFQMVVEDSTSLTLFRAA